MGKDSEAMKGYGRRNCIVWLGLILMLAVLFAASVSCWGSPNFTLIVENQTEYNLTVYVNDYKIGNVNPGEQLKDTGLLWDTGKYHIEAKNIKGEIIFSETLTREKMQRIGSRVYKVAIPPLQNK
jgi:hypothetical protein